MFERQTHTHRASAIQYACVKSLRGEIWPKKSKEKIAKSFCMKKTSIYFMQNI